MDKLFYNGIIYTMNQNYPVCEAVGIKGGRITFIGKNDDGLLLADSETKKINLDGKAMFPGFVDGHIHAPGNAYSILFNINLYDWCSIKKVDSLFSRIS